MSANRESQAEISISGAQEVENFTSDLRGYHQNVQN